MSAAVPRQLRIVHLFPDLMNVYGDRGNVQVVVERARRRGIDVDFKAVVAGDATVPPADLLLIGGGQDQEQVTVARELQRMAPAIRTQVTDGAGLLAVCGGYQNLGTSYLTGAGVEIEGPGILDLRTIAGDNRLVGPMLATLAEPLRTDAPAARTTVVGFENHSGRTHLGPTARPFATVEIGHGNNGLDGGEGILAMPGEGGMGGLRIGTYLHGPLLPSNPHVADALIAAALGRGDELAELAALDDGAEWRAHDHRAAELRARHAQGLREGARPRWVRRIVDPLRSLIGF